MKKKPIIFIIITVLVLIFLAVGSYFMFFNKVSDAKLLENLEEEITNIEESFDEVEAIEDELQVDISEDVSEDDELLDELSAELNLVEEDLEQVDNAETELNSSID